MVEKWTPFKKYGPFGFGIKMLKIAWAVHQADATQRTFHLANLRFLTVRRAVDLRPPGAGKVTASNNGRPPKGHSPMKSPKGTQKNSPEGFSIYRRLL